MCRRGSHIYMFSSSFMWHALGNGEIYGYISTKKKNGFVKIPMLFVTRNMELHLVEELFDSRRVKYWPENNPEYTWRERGKHGDHLSGR